MGNADAVKKLRKLFKAITDEAARNEKFAADVAAALGIGDEKSKPTAKKTNRRDPAVLNPVKLIAEDAADLETRLLSLGEKELKDIIAEFALDPARQSSRLRKKEKLVALIMERAQQWATKGDVFK